MLLSNLCSGFFPKRITPVLATICVAGLAGCGTNAEEGNGSADQTATQSDGSASQNIELSSAPIMVAGAFEEGAVSRGGSRSCPFLSTETALQTVQTSFELELRKASTSECVWNYNDGFEIGVTVEDKASAKPISERAYNMNSPPLIEAQSGPGEEAAVAFDTTWKENKPMAYAFGFSQGDKYIHINTTGLTTDAEKLRNTANEIAEKLPDAANQPADGAPFSMCSQWNEATLRSLFSSNGAIHFHMGDGGRTCAIELRPLSDERQLYKINLELYRGDQSVCDDRMQAGGEKVEIASMEMVKMTGSYDGRIEQNYHACLDDGVFALEMDAPNDVYQSQIEVLLSNAASRLQ